MVVLHFIKNLDSNGVAYPFVNDCLDGGKGDAVHVLTVSPKKSFPLLKNAVYYSLVDKPWSMAACRRRFGKIVGEVHPDIIHIHSFWSFNAWLVYRLARHFRIPVVVSVYKGMMPWNFAHRYFTEKLPMFTLFTRSMLKNAAAVHCVTKQEFDVMKGASWNPWTESRQPLNDRLALICCEKDGTENSVGSGGTKVMLDSLYRKVADSNPFMLMTDEDRAMENDLLSLGASVSACNGDTSGIFLPVKELAERVGRMTDESWRRIQLHSDTQGTLPLVCKAMETLDPQRQMLDVDAVERFGYKETGVFLETARTKIRVSRVRQMCDEYSRYETERKICIMLLNLKYLFDRNLLSRKNMADFYETVRFGKYNDYVLENMFEYLGIKRFAARVFYILHVAMDLEEGFIPIPTKNDFRTRRMMRKLFKSNIQ